MFLKCFRIISLILLICWMGLIFSLSEQPAVESSETSGGIIEKIAAVVFPDFKNLSVDEQQEIVSSFQFVIRKGAHLTIFGILGLLSFLTVVSYRHISLKVRVIISSGFCLIYAIFDELHQLNVRGRSGEFRDVCIDFLGSMLVIITCTLISRYYKRIYKLII